MESDNVDRISVLPDHVLDHILFFLPTNHVARTSILSKRWANVLSSVPSLDFSLDFRKRTFDGFFKFLDSVLRRRDESSIQRIRFFALQTTKFVDAAKVMSWINSVSERNVEVVDIYLNWGFTVLDITLFPLFTFASLIVLKLRLGDRWVLILPNSLLLPSLEILHLTCTQFETDVLLSGLLSSCPSLHTLSLCQCSIKNEQLTIDIPQLENLTIDHCRSHSVKIFAPRLITLTLEGRCQPIAIQDCPSLAHAQIGIIMCTPQLLQQLMRALHTAVSLKFDLEFLEECAVQCIERPFSNLKFLKLQTYFCNSHVQLIKTLLKFSPVLETLVIKHVEMEESEESPREEGEFEYGLACLRLVRFEGYAGHSNEIKFVEFFIEKAVTLNKLILVSQCYNYNQEEKCTEALAQIRNVLYDCPRVLELCVDTSDDVFPSLT